MRRRRKYLFVTDDGYLALYLEILGFKILRRNGFFYVYADFAKN